MEQLADERRIEYMPLAVIDAAPRNPKRHAAADIRTSLTRFGLAELPLLDERTGRLVAGHGRLDQIAEMRRTGSPPPRYVRVDPSGEWLVPVERGWASQDDDHAEAYLVTSNHLAAKGGWDNTELGEMLSEIRDADHALFAATGFTDDALDALLGIDDQNDDAGGGSARLTDDDDIPTVDDREAIARLGDVFHLGPHRIACGDTTDPNLVARLLTGLPPATLIHADPPYGMGKEADGVLNDNLYGAHLDAFQMRWWATWRPHWADNGSAYIWGNAPDLWRLWWLGGLGQDPDLMVRTEVVWDKGSGIGMRSDGNHCYPVATERCLFLMRGEQFLGNQNKDDYWEGNEPLRAWLTAERDKAGLTNKQVNEITGTQMAGHWFGKSQFQIISRRHYDMIRAAAEGRAFDLTFDELFAKLFPDVRDGGNGHRRELSAAMRAGRSFFDNTHDAMTDVWQFGRVVGEDRFGHATPKPVAMVERALLSSSQEGDTVAVPFGGTGPEFIAAHHLGRVAVGAELQPAYVDVICRRFQEHTGITPERERADGTRDPVVFG